MPDEATNEHLDFLEKQMKEKDNKIAELGGYAASSIYGSQQQDSNLIMWQLELDNILERIEHLLRGDIIKESAGALPTHILAAGIYHVLARYGGKNYKREFTVVPGGTENVEVVIQ